MTADAMREARESLLELAGYIGIFAGDRAATREILDRARDAFFALSAAATATDARKEQPRLLKPEQVEWVVNDIAELGVKIGDQFFFLYKGRSLVYGTEANSRAAGVALINDSNDPPTPHRWRRVFKREFGECCHPVNYQDPTRIGTVSPDDSDEWRDLPAAPEMKD